MTRRPTPALAGLLLVALLVVAAACGGDDASVDAGTDGGDAAWAVRGPTIPWLAEDGPVTLTPCPEGWGEVSGETTECHPYAGLEPMECPAGEAHFLGEAGCQPIGAPCPDGEFAEDLPSTGPVIYVSARTASGGDGSFASPFATFADVSWSGLASGTTVALGKGTYSGVLSLRAGVRVVGACARETRLVGLAAPALSVVTVVTAGEPAGIANLSIVDPPQFGVVMRDDGQVLEIEGVLIEGAIEAAVAAPRTGSTVRIRDSVIRSTRSNSSGANGRGIVVQNGGRVEATRVVLDDNAHTGVFAGDVGSEVVLRDVLVVDTQAQVSDGRFGRGISAINGARIDVERALVLRSHDIGIASSQEGTVVALTDVVVRDTLPRVADDSNGRGLNAQGGGAIEANRLLIVGCRDVGVIASSAPTRVTLSQVVVRDTLPELSSDNFGRAIGVQLGASLEGTGLRLVHNRELGIYVGGEGSNAVITDLLVDDVQPRGFDGAFGRGVDVFGGGQLTLSRAVIRNVIEVGIEAFTGAVIDATDVVVDGVARSRCMGLDCDASPYGYGAAASSGTLRLERFRVSGASTCGAFVGVVAGSTGEPFLGLANGTVRGSEIGACVQVAGYDLDRLVDDVSYEENGSNLDSTSLPVPRLPEEL